MTYPCTKKISRNAVNRGFTLIEILVVIGMIAILASIVLIAINPARQFAQARNTQRIANVNAILNAIGQRIAEQQGRFAGDNCMSDMPDEETDISNDPNVINKFNLRNCLVPTYISELPFDPALGSNNCKTELCNENDERYDTHYTVSQDPLNKRVTVCAPGSSEPSIPGSAKYCLTR